jgi:hypothetical protein
VTWRRRGVKGSPSGYRNRSRSFEEDRVRRSPADARHMIGDHVMPGQPRDGQSGPGNTRAVVRREARGPGTFSVASPGGMTGSLSGATLPPDDGSFIQILRSSLATGRWIRAPPETGLLPRSENKSVLIKSSIISGARRAPTAPQSRRPAGDKLKLDYKSHQL